MTMLFQPENIKHMHVSTPMNDEKFNSFIRRHPDFKGNVIAFDAHKSRTSTSNTGGYTIYLTDAKLAAQLANKYPEKNYLDRQFKAKGKLDTVFFISERKFPQQAQTNQHGKGGNSRNNQEENLEEWRQGNYY